MATNTPVFGLRKPTNQDVVNVATVISANMDLIDAHAHSGTYVGVGDLVYSIAGPPYNAVEGGVVDCRAAIQAAVDAGHAYVPPGLWRVTGEIEFLGNNRSLVMAPGAILVVDNGYTGNVFKFASVGSTSTRWCHVYGGTVMEAGCTFTSAGVIAEGTAQQNWTGVLMHGIAKGVFFSGVVGTKFLFPGTAIVIKTDYGTTTDAFVTYTSFEDVTVWHPRILVDFQTNGTTGLDGIAMNNFVRVYGQSGTLTTNGFRNITGRRNSFDNASIVDLNANPAAVSANIVAGAIATLIMGGTVTAQNWVDLGDETVILDDTYHSLNGNLDVPEGELTLDNDRYLRWKDAGAVAQNTLRLTASGTLEVIAPGAGKLSLRVTGANNLELWTNGVRRAYFSSGGILNVEGEARFLSTITRISGVTVSVLAGAGTPEGVTTAPIGSVYHRTDGGAGTSFYVKESGAGNTGWAAK